MYALNLTDESRISVLVPPACEPYAPANYIRVEKVPSEVEENASDYKYVDGEFVLDPLPVPEPEPADSEKLAAQVVYTAMMTDTLLDESEV